MQSRILVIDASIARAAGDISTHPTSRSCREFLQSVLDICHQMAMTDSLHQEWNNHQSKFARRWRVSMMARKKIVAVNIQPKRSLKNRIRRAVPDQSIRALIDKDRHLIEAALITQERVASLDDQVRKHLANHCVSLTEVNSICWINPAAPSEKAIEWLKAGAPPERHRRLDQTRDD